MIRIDRSRAHAAGAILFTPCPVRPVVLWAMPGLILSTACAPRVGTPAPIVHASPVASAEALPHVTISDNRRPAGRLQKRVLTLRLEARNGVWYPEGPEGLGLPVAAFAEEGKPLQNPGPLVRVPAGTEVRATVRNSLAKPLTIFGFGERRGIAADSIRIEPGAVGEVRFQATIPGPTTTRARRVQAPCSDAARTTVSSMARSWWTRRG